MSATNPCVCRSPNTASGALLLTSSVVPSPRTRDRYFVISVSFESVARENLAVGDEFPKNLLAAKNFATFPSAKKHRCSTDFLPSSVFVSLDHDFESSEILTTKIKLFFYKEENPPTPRIVPPRGPPAPDTPPQLDSPSHCLGPELITELFCSLPPRCRCVEARPPSPSFPPSS